MATRKVRPKRREFTPGTAKCVVVTIRAVFDLGNFTTEHGDTECVTRLLEEARSYGAAEVVERMAVVEDFDTASKILHTHRVKES